MFNILTFAASAPQVSSEAVHGGVNALSLGGKDVLAAQAQTVAGSAILPLEVVLIMIGTLLVSGFALLLRESRIERKASEAKDH